MATGVHVPARPLPSIALLETHAMFEAICIDPVSGKTVDRRLSLFLIAAWEWAVGWRACGLAAMVRYV